MTSGQPSTRRTYDSLSGFQGVGFRDIKAVWVQGLLVYTLDL